MVKTGTKGRMIIAEMQHVGIESIEAETRFDAKYDHPLMTGFCVAGDENVGDF